MIRFDHIVVGFIVLVLMFLFVYAIDAGFSSSYETEFHKYDYEFQRTRSEMATENYEGVISISDQVLKECDPGSNDILAKTYKGIANLKLGRKNVAIDILYQLMEEYPGIKIIYAGLMVDKSDENILYILNQVTTEYVNGMMQTSTREMSFMDMISSMSKRHWIQLFFILVGSVVAYERIRRKWFSQN